MKAHIPHAPARDYKQSRPDEVRLRSRCGAHQHPKRRKRRMRCTDAAFGHCEKKIRRIAHVSPSHERTSTAMYLLQFRLGRRTALAADSESVIALKLLDGRQEERFV